MVLFAAEWGDLSQLLTVSLVGRFDAVSVFVGAWSALLVVSGLAVVAGRVLLGRLRLAVLHYVGGSVCLLLAALTAYEIALVDAATSISAMSIEGAQTERAHHGANSEVGRLRTVMLHRPGPELKRLTPRNNDKLLFDGIPWISRAQDEHDAFAQALRDRDVEVLYLMDLLTETLQSETAREHAIAGAMSSLHLGDTLRTYLTSALRDQSAEGLASYLTAGVRNDEVRGGFGLVTSLLQSDDFLIDPLPNLLFTRDSSVWVKDRVAVTSLAMPARERETQLTELIYTEHPRFAGTPTIHGWQREHVEGGDVLLLADGVVAIGVGERTTPAGAERLARQLFGAGLAHTVLAVPIAQERATMHLDTVCTMVDVDKIVMYPNVAHDPAGVRRHLHRARRPERHRPGPRDSGGGAVPGGRGQGHEHRHAAPDRHRSGPGHCRARAVGRRQQHPGDLSPRVAVAYERNIETNSRLEEAGDRGRRHRRLRAGLRSRWSALHVLPHLPGAAGPGLTEQRTAGSIGPGAPGRLVGNGPAEPPGRSLAR